MSLLTPGTEYKILFTGAMGSGKTSAIASISEIPPMMTDVPNTSTDGNGKATTTVGLDYGEISLDRGDRLRLYGTPGQKRFSALWEILSRGALGVIILVDHSAPDAPERLEEFLDAFEPLIRRTGGVIGVTHADLALDIGFDRYYEQLGSRSLMLPVLPADARSREDVLQLVEALLSLLEVGLSDMERETR